MIWTTKGFEAFAEGSFENGGQNLYVSKHGILQRIFHYDINLDGYPDLLFGCSQSMCERPPVYVYTDPLHPKQEPLLLPTNGTYDGCMADLHGSGFQDLIIACQNDGQHSDIASMIYFGSEQGWSEKYKMELPAPNTRSVCVGDFDGDGKKEILFVSNGRLRLFYQRERGFGPTDFRDLALPAAVVVAADLDGDGCDDLVFKDDNGRYGVVFGGKDGLNITSVLWLEVVAAAPKSVTVSSTEGAVPGVLTARPCFVILNGERFLFVSDPVKAYFYRCDSQRRFSLAFLLDCPDAVYAASADLDGDGCEELALAVFSDRDEVADCRIYHGQSDGFPRAYETLPLKGCISVTAARLDTPVFIFCRTGESVIKEVPCPVVGIDTDGDLCIRNELLGGDCSRILAGRPQGGQGSDTVVMVNHMLGCGEGHEDIYVYLGGPDGYCPERKLSFGGHSAVGGTMADFFDSGNVDVLVDNCFEDAPFLDDGAYLYRNDGNGGVAELLKIPTVRGHGSSIGDFRKSGYLDIAAGGFRNREFCIFHGSEQGYSAENCTRILLGPPTEGGYTPPVFRKGDSLELEGSEKALTTEYGEVRWTLAADFNGDGWLDIFVSEIAGSCSYILWGGPEGFSETRMQTLYTDGVASATTADLDGDGYLDLILPQHASIRKNSRYESYVTIYWGGPEGYLENRKTQLPASCANACTVGDYSGQGKLDLYAVSYRNSRCRDVVSHLYPNDGKGNFGMYNVQYLFNHSGSGCVSGDFNGDGYTDLAVACHKEYGNHIGHSFVFWGGPDGLSDDRKTVLPTVGPHGMCSVDPGNIMDRSPKEHYTSIVKELPAGQRVTSVSWEGVCTSTSYLEIEVRAAATAEAIADAPWQLVTAGEDLSDKELTGFVQYRLALCATCSCGTPRVERVTVVCE